MWRKPTVRDLAATLNQSEIDQYRQAPDFESGADPAMDLVERTAEFVRGFIRDGARRNRRVSMSPERCTLPESLISKAMDYAAFDVLKRINMDPGESRKDARKSAEEFFAKLAEGEYTPEPYDPESGSEGGSSGLALPQFGKGRKKILNGYL